MRSVDFTGFTALHMFLTEGSVVVSFTVVWWVSLEYMGFVAIPNAIDVVDYVYPIEDMVTGFSMMTATTILLLETVKLQIGTSE
jgi:hypothetical protein